MKPKEIYLQITKNLGNFESVRLGITVELDEFETPDECFSVANDALKTNFESLFKENVFVTEPKRKPLVKGTVEFDRVKAALIAKTATIEDVEKYYYVDIDVMKELLILKNK